MSASAMAVETFMIDEIPDEIEFACTCEKGAIDSIVVNPIDPKLPVVCTVFDDASSPRGETICQEKHVFDFSDRNVDGATILLCKPEGHLRINSNQFTSVRVTIFERKRYSKAAFP